MSLDDPLSLAEAAAAVKERRISAAELTRAALDRARSSHEQLNAFIEIEEEAALRAAHLADEALARGQATGPFHGVPLAHKDMYDRKGFITGCGSKIRQSHVATETSTVMQRLEAAGAMSIGRLNMSEFAMGPTGYNFHYGRALNPIDPERITGGSSSGCGSAVGGGVVTAALGSDTGGSIRLPAACCGIVGIKPTQGRVSRHGVMPLSFSQDCVGPLARTVEDAYSILRVIAGPDGRDTTCMAVAGPAPLMDEIGALRVGILGGLFESGLEDAVATAIETTAHVLENEVAWLGMSKGIDMPSIAELANVVAMAEAGTVHFDWMRKRAEDYGPQIRMRLAQSLAIPAPIYIRALQMRSVLLEAFLNEAFGDTDILIAPAMPALPPLSSEVDIGTSPKMNAVVSAMTSFTRPFSFLGLPVVTLPVAVSPGGLPIAIQIIARPWREDLAASLARRLELILSLAAFTPSTRTRSAA
ncbi:MAG: amidase [Rhizobium rhizophilum]|uniref:amidase n=1 Tax=Rhizobium rhizophilum TaxID=1850373 RepID=UPI00391CE08C